MAWGLEIESEMLRLCRAEVRQGRFHLHRRAEVAVPPGLIQPSQKDGNVADATALGRLLRELCKNAGCRGWVRVALPDPVFSLRTLASDELPVKREDAQRFLRWQARELLPFPADEARLDFLPLGPGPDGRPRAVCLVARDRILAEYERVLADAGLRAAVLDARSISLAQAASEPPGRGTVALLHVGKTWTTLLVAQEGRPRFWRILHEGLPGWTGDDRTRLLREVADSLIFCRESEGMGTIEGMALAGLGTWAEMVASALTEWLAIPVSAMDLRAALRTDGHADDLAQWGPAIGAAIRPC
ncbi:MAG: type IV pilus biogenesis protein PilM [Candidatus Methylomirabilales bacterium]